MDPQTRKAPNRTLYLLPSLFTLSSIFCGFSAICVASAASKPDDLVRAAFLILIAAVFDAVDGRIARLTRTQSEFGTQLDSLADAISFGVAPAFLLYRWGLSELPGVWGEVICFTFIAAGVCRLARFNVLAARNSGGQSEAVGLPIPASAALLVSLVVAHVEAGGGFLEAVQAMSAVTLTISYLMVSNIPYRMFKRVKPSDPRSLAVLVCLGLLSAACVLFLNTAFVLVALSSAYVVSGLLDVLVGSLRRGASQAAIPEVLSIDQSNDDEPHVDP